MVNVVYTDELTNHSHENLNAINDKNEDKQVKA